MSIAIHLKSANNMDKEKKAIIEGYVVYNNTYIELIDDGHGLKMLRINGTYYPIRKPSDEPVMPIRF